MMGHFLEQFVYPVLMEDLTVSTTICHLYIQLILARRMHLLTVCKTSYHILLMYYVVIL